jgi:flagellar basal-body rod protein FlgB
LAFALLNVQTDKAMSNMIEKSVFSKVGVPMLSKFLDLSSLRHKLIAGNIANVSTPSFRARDIDFHGELEKAVGKKTQLSGTITHKSHLPIGHTKERGPEIVIDKKSGSNGINNVDIDKEVANMAKNQIYYSIGAELLSRKFDGIKNAIRSK